MVWDAEIIKKYYHLIKPFVVKSSIMGSRGLKTALSVQSIPAQGYFGLSNAGDVSKYE